MIHSFRANLLMRIWTGLLLLMVAALMGSIVADATGQPRPTNDCEHSPQNLPAQRQCSRHACWVCETRAPATRDGPPVCASPMEQWTAATGMRQREAQTRP